MSRFQFSPPASCFTSPWGVYSNTDALAGTVYVTVSVGCALPQLPQCCGPFTNVGIGIEATSQICPNSYGYFDVITDNDATYANCCPTVYGFTGLNDVGECQISPPSTTATGTGYVTVTITSAQDLWAVWNQEVLNGLSTTPDLSAAPSAAVSTTDALYSSSTLVPSLVLVPVSTTDTPYSTPTHSAIPTWSGSGSLLQGYCTTPQYVILDGPTAYWAPIVGCADGKSDCCPYSVASIGSPTVVTVVSTVTVNIGPSGTSQPDVPDLQGYPVAVNPNQATLARCPDDYVTISGGCCPSGYQLWNAPLGGQVPCYSSLSSYLVPPAIEVQNTNSPLTAPTISAAASSTTTQMPTSAIVNVVYAIQYPVQPASGLSTSTKAGIGARASVRGLAIIGLAFFL